RNPSLLLIIASVTLYSCIELHTHYLLSKFNSHGGVLPALCYGHSTLCSHQPFTGCTSVSKMLSQEDKVRAADALTGSCWPGNLEGYWINHLDAKG
uniref:Uncharacterized protein n=1 Tax=Strigops habroptila TaxID=2489341 RepID=A0A672UYY2_STRHB